MNGCGGKFLRLFRVCVLVFTVTVLFAPCYRMGNQQTQRVCGIDVQLRVFPPNSDKGTGVAVWYTETTSFIIYKTIERMAFYFAQNWSTVSAVKLAVIAAVSVVKISAANIMTNLGISFIPNYYKSPGVSLARMVISSYHT